MKIKKGTSDLVTEKVVQQNLFYDEHSKSKKMMAAMDLVNKYIGKEVVRMAAQGFKRGYKLRADHLSPKYTTRISDVLKVRK